jgi:hypothetical protein
MLLQVSDEYRDFEEHMESTARLQGCSPADLRDAGGPCPEFTFRVLLLPKFRLNVQFIHALNKAANVVTEDFAKGFVHLSRLCSASK